MKKSILSIFIMIPFVVFSQGIITGKVIDSNTREALPFVSVIIYNSNVGSSTNEEGMFTISNSPLGYQKLKVSYLGFETIITEEYLVTNKKSPFVLIELKEVSEKLNEIIVKKQTFAKSIINPLSKQMLGLAEIEKNPGGNRDVLKVIQSLPGVATNPGFRNDIIIRGGATSENKFYVDGIEVPVINHFQTQGATGGPVGLINADLIRKVDFFSSGFTSNRGNALSAIIEFTQKYGNPNSINTRATLGTSDAGVTMDGPINKNTTFIASLRQSYLQYLFKLIKLPFLPTYTDYQLNIKSMISPKNQFSFMALGAIDNFKLNESVNENVTDEITKKRNQYILGNIPIQEQWNYTLGVTWKHFGDSSNQLYVVSRNEWSNNSFKYLNNTSNQTDLLYDYTSKEIENKFRFENNSTLLGFKLNAGIGLEQSMYTNTTYRKLANANGVTTRNFSSKLKIFKYALFAHASKEILNSRLGLSFGIRLDGNNYNSFMKNGLNQFSPRMALSYQLNDKLSLNASIGSYYQLPSYTVLGYRNNTNDLVNQSNLKFINSKHVVTGIEFLPNENTKISLEGFYKHYDKYPFSVRNQISLANLGADFGVIGNEEVTSTSKGRAYGFELFIRKQSMTNLYGILSYTFVRSEFTNQIQQYIPSSWDNRHLLSVTAGKKLKKSWEMGAKFRLVGGKPYTPYDMNASSIIANYNVLNAGILDFNKLNSNRFGMYTQLDLRIDKTWFWKKFSLNFYMDVQNLLASKSQSQFLLLPSEDMNGNKIIDPADSNRYVLDKIDNVSGNILPGIGLVIDF